jgi:organic radical activating enzyme
MINEIFNGIQGEGKTQGQYRQFIRMNGCNLSCKFCDTRYTWGRGDNKVKLPRKLHSRIAITGGEPTLKDNWKFISCNILSRPEVDWVEVETNGTGTFSYTDIQRLGGKVNLWNISPKRNEDMAVACKTDPKLLHFKDYLDDYIVKFVVRNSDDLLFVKKIQKKYKVPKEKIWLMPYTLPNAPQINSGVTERVYDLAFANKYNFSARLHVLIKGNARGI